MNGTFEDRLLAELQAEMAGRAPRENVPASSRWTTGRRLVAAAGVAGLAAAAIVAVPLVTGSTASAYAVTENPDGSITLTIHELRDPEGVERDLAAAGVPADITYLPLGKSCARPRFSTLDEDSANMPTRQELESKDPAVHARAVRKIESTPSRRAIRLRDGIRIYPRYIRPGQTVVIVLSENPKQPTVKHPGVAWEFSGDLAVGPVKPCTPVDVPGAFDIGDGTPPPGS